MDRIDREYMREQQKEMREERQADLAKAGPLLNPKQEQQLENFLTHQCWLTPAAAKGVMETIKGLAGEDGASPKQVLKDALEGHVKPAFLKNDGNFTEATSLLTTAIADREQRIVEMKAPAVAQPSGASSFTPPRQGR